MSAAQDGRARAIEAALDSGLDPDACYSEPRLREIATRAIDAALADGGVRLTDPGEPNVSVEAYWQASEERDQAEAERDALRELLVSAEGYALAKGADRPFAWMFAADAPQVEVIERAGCYPRDARREHPGRFWLNPPPERERTS